MRVDLWVEKYRPKKLLEVLGNEQAKLAFIDWLKSKKRRKKAILLYGPPGVGKTALVNAASSEFGFRILELNASDTRTENAINKVVGPATSFVALDKFSVGGQGNLLFLDEVDGVFGNQDRGGIKGIVKLVEDSQIPVVMAANNTDLQKLRPLKKVCELIRFQPVRVPFIIVMLRKICLMEHVDAELEVLERIAQNSHGDMRSAINDLQQLAADGRYLTLQETMLLNDRNREVNMYETLKGIFTAESSIEVLTILNRSSVDHEELLLYICDNLPNRYIDHLELGKAYDLISRADIFNSRIGVENWGLLRYLYNFLAEVAMVNPKSKVPFEFITPPMRVTTLFWTRGKRMTLEKICAKIGSKCHVSRSIAKQDILPYIKSILQKQKSSSLAQWLKLEPEEVDYIVKMSKI